MLSNILQANRRKVNTIWANMKVCVLLMAVTWLFAIEPSPRRSVANVVDHLPDRVVARGAPKVAGLYCAHNNDNYSEGMEQLVGCRQDETGKTRENLSQ